MPEAFPRAARRTAASAMLTCAAATLAAFVVGHHAPAPLAIARPVTRTSAAPRRTASTATPTAVRTSVAPPPTVAAPSVSPAPRSTIAVTPPTPAPSTPPPSPSTSAPKTSPKTSPNTSPATTAAPSAAPNASRRQPTAAEVQAAIAGLRQYLPLAPSADQVAQVGDQVCSAFDAGQSAAQVEASAQQLLSQVPFVSDVTAAANYAVHEAVGLYCPVYASRLT